MKSLAALCISFNFVLVYEMYKDSSKLPRGIGLYSGSQLLTQCILNETQTLHKENDEDVKREQLNKWK